MDTGRKWNQLDGEDILQSSNDYIYDRFDLVIRSCDNIHNLSKSEFIRKLFNDAFKLIPEAQKGSFYELVGDRYVPYCSKGYDEALLARITFGVEEAFVDFECTEADEIIAKQITIKSRDRTLFDPEMIAVFQALGTYENFTSLYAPVRTGGIDVGIICLDNFSEASFSPLSVRTLKFYAQLMSSYYAQRLNQERISQVHMETVSALVSSIEVNDPYTEGHGKRVSYYAKHLACAMKLPQNVIAELETAGLLHDIGKLGIPSDILNKSSSLTDSEYAIIRKHPENTRKILESIKGLHRIREFTYCHHEHYDGSGYPRGLKGEEIPFESQIISVADAFDAMTSDRAYRKALSAEEAVAIIRSEAGKQFAPRLSETAAKIFPGLYQKIGQADDLGNAHCPEAVNSSKSIQ